MLPAFALSDHLHYIQPVYAEGPMNEGATEPVEQAVAPAVAPTGRPGWKSLWERLKSFWWFRGAASAFAIVGVVEQLGFGRGWLRFVHAIGARWNEWMGWVTANLSIALPFDWNITPGEGNVLTLWSALVIPAMTAQWQAYSRSEYKTTTWRISVIMNFVTVLCVFATVLFWDDPGLGAEVTALRIIVYGLLIIIMIAALWQSSRGYLKALSFTLAFVAALELLHFAPVLADGMKPAIDWIDPGGIET
jgi:hypothetical protein